MEGGGRMQRGEGRKKRVIQKNNEGRREGDRDGGKREEQLRREDRQKREKKGGISGFHTGF